MDGLTDLRRRSSTAIRDICPNVRRQSLPGKTAYVGNRRDNDILPALNAGLTTVFIRRGRWSYCYATRPEAERRMCASTASWHCLSGCAAAVATAERASLAEKSMVD
jgi:ribonucleotide monophosphatase NagD (HAD superfamily)